MLHNIGRGSSSAAYAPDWIRVSSDSFKVFKGYSYEGARRVPAIVRHSAQPGRGRIAGTQARVMNSSLTMRERAGIAYAERRDGRATPSVQDQLANDLAEQREAAKRPRDKPTELKATLAGYAQRNEVVGVPLLAECIGKGNTCRNRFGGIAQIDAYFLCAAVAAAACLQNTDPSKEETP